jgi:hypothetical protein
MLRRPGDELLGGSQDIAGDELGGRGSEAWREVHERLDAAGSARSRVVSRVLWPSPAPCPRSVDRDRRDGRSRGALELERLDDEGELVDAGRGQLVQLHPLHEMDAVDRQHDLVDR